MVDPLTLISISAKASFGIYNMLNSYFESNKMKKNISAIDKKLAILNEKSDQMITREIRSAFDAINDALTSNNKATRDIRLKLAEESLLKNTRLNPALETEGQGNHRWIALSNFGLAYICFLRYDQRLAVRHLLKAFVVAPRMARNELASEVFKSIFEPDCRDLVIEENKIFVGEPFFKTLTLLDPILFKPFLFTVLSNFLIFL